MYIAINNKEPILTNLPRETDRSIWILEQINTRLGNWYNKQEKYQQDFKILKPVQDLINKVDLVETYITLGLATEKYAYFSSK